MIQRALVLESEGQRSISFGAGLSVLRRLQEIVDRFFGILPSVNIVNIDLEYGRLKLEDSNVRPCLMEKRFALLDVLRALQELCS